MSQAAERGMNGMLARRIGITHYSDLGNIFARMEHLY
jgi:hypothetical protein